MSSFRRAWWGVVVAVLAATVGFPPEPADPVQASPAAGSIDPFAGPPDVLPPDQQWTVTLLTGERVGVASDAEGHVDVRVRDADSPLRILRQPDGDVYVLPSSAGALLDGELDHELFNVTDLVRQGFDDQSTEALPVIVQHAPAVAGNVAHSAAPGGDAPQPLPSIDAVAIEVPRSDPAAATRLLDEIEVPAGARLAAPPLVWLDRRIEAPASAPKPAPTAAAAEGRRPRPSRQPHRADPDRCLHGLIPRERRSVDQRSRWTASRMARA
jgi:hypothetical protein